MKQLAILISNAGTGSNLQAIIDASKKGFLKANIKVVVSDAEDAYGLHRARKHRISTYIFDKTKDPLDKLLTKTYPVDYVVLSGWKKIIPDDFLRIFSQKILNIHPGLIPATRSGVVKTPDGAQGLWNKGMFTKKALQNFLDQKASYAGSTVHFLTDEFDFGPVLGQAFEKIQKTDTAESLYARLKKREHIILLNALKTLCN